MKTGKINNVSTNNEIVFFFNNFFHRLLSEIENNETRLFKTESLAEKEIHLKNLIRKLIYLKIYKKKLTKLR